jgi:hypothetical protein
MLRSACDDWHRVVPCVSLHHASATGALPFCFELTAIVFTLLLVLEHVRSLRWNDYCVCGYHVVLLLHMECYNTMLIEKN